MRLTALIKHVGQMIVSYAMKRLPQIISTKGILNGRYLMVDGTRGDQKGPLRMSGP